MNTDYCNEQPCTHHDQQPLHPMARVRCSLHDIPLTWEEGGPTEVTIYGRWYCMECNAFLMRVLDQASARVDALREMGVACWSRSAAEQGWDNEGGHQ